MRCEVILEQPLNLLVDMRLASRLLGRRDQDRLGMPSLAHMRPILDRVDSEYHGQPPR